MRASTRRELIDGPVGRLECAIDLPQGEARGLAIVAHPHPLHGGTLDNKVAQTLARAHVEAGYATVRPNFRGVGRSEGAHDASRGEVDDLAAALAYLRAAHGALPLALAGFSFGAAMQLKLASREPPRSLVLVGVAVGYADTPPAPPGTAVIHGEQDETVPLAGVLDWARPQDLPVTVIPGADHFLHRRLNLLRALVAQHLK